MTAPAVAPPANSCGTPLAAYDDGCREAWRLLGELLRAGVTMSQLIEIAAQMERRHER